MVLYDSHRFNFVILSEARVPPGGTRAESKDPSSGKIMRVNVELPIAAACWYRDPSLRMTA